MNQATPGYAWRAVAEGTISQAVLAMGRAPLSLPGQNEDAEWQQVLTATAINFVRIANRLAGVPPAKTRQASFVNLMKQLILITFDAGERFCIWSGRFSMIMSELLFPLTRVLLPQRLTRVPLPPVSQ